MIFHISKEYKLGTISVGKWTCKKGNTFSLYNPLIYTIRKFHRNKELFVQMEFTYCEKNSFRFGMATELEKVVYPQFLHPLKHITLTASILMIVSLSLERYCAVHSPMEFRQVYYSKSIHIFYLSDRCQIDVR